MKVSDSDLSMAAQGLMQGWDEDSLPVLGRLFGVQPANASAPSSVSFNEYNPGNDPEHKANLIRDELRAGTMTPARATALLEDGGFTMKQIEDLFAEAGKR